MEVPAPAAGKVTELKADVGDKVSEGTVILVLESADGDKPAEEPKDEEPEKEEPEKEAPEAPKAEGDVNVQVAVLGAGPGGYTAAFRAADLGLSVALVEEGDVLGGVGRNVGCIPSKALLHVARVMSEVTELEGISYGEPEIDVDKVRAWKESVVGKLTGGLESLAKQRKI